MTPRAVTAADLPALNALNNDYAAEVNALTPAAFAALVGACWYARRLQHGFLLALDHLAPAQGPNHAWFLARRPAFGYVDRVVIAAAGQGQGMGRALYEDLFAAAAARSLPGIGCEVNLAPPNPGSLAFHARLGFSPLAEAVDPRNGKHLRYLWHELGASAPCPTAAC